ncbi:aminotransferase function [Xylona heveae TC161]|uniref:Aminotransferase function n=1 Tax=Xylona heveae (strain CBS 132557 / TC161) TaxID=1328760 RepID=A0A165JGX5_XYLHT|nr:aminotransferase function [Xylona heveae TC161]KZF26224.1 aminotransferase function [Xylona heveae TC161]
MDAHETTAKYNIAETCSSSVSIQDLRAISGDTTTDLAEVLFQRKLTYGPIPGSEELRSNVANLYADAQSSALHLDQVLISSGAISANFLVLYSLVGKGDHVICHYPTYQQLYSIPASSGAEVSLWKANPEKGWAVDIEELKRLIKPNTKLIIINNPQNPTGAVLSRSQLADIVEVASKQNITVFADEVYRPLFHSLSPAGSEIPPSILSMGYPNTVATGSLSKAYSLAGVRVGWIASRNPDIIKACATARGYTTISVSQLDDRIATWTLSKPVVEKLLERNLRLARTNLAILEEFMNRHTDCCEWVKPVAGTTGFVRFHKNGKPVNGVQFCETLQDRKGVMLCPGAHCFGEEFQGYVRIGYVSETEVLQEGLKELDAFLKDDFQTLF